MKNFELKIAEGRGQTKVQQVVHSITEAVGNGMLREGDPLPSVNQLSRRSGISRDTVFKAYRILKQRAVIESAPTKGYYVANESYKVFMLLDDFSAFKEQLYQSFRGNLPASYSVDLLFHHYNPEVFNQLIQNSLGRYSRYLVMNIDHKSMAPILKKIDVNKLLLLDMGNPPATHYNFLLQDFGRAVDQCLQQGLSALKKYRELVLVYSKPETPHPEETVTAVVRFCRKHGIPLRKVSRAGSIPVQKGQAWFVIRDADLVEVIKSCRTKGLALGNDVGVLSYNDTPMKQIVGGGISVITTNFEKMGQLAAGFVRNRQKIARVLPTSLLLRGSL